MRSNLYSFLLFVLMFFSSTNALAYRCYSMFIGSIPFYWISSNQSTFNERINPIRGFGTNAVPSSLTTNCPENGNFANLYGFEYNDILTYNNNLTVLSGHTTSINTLTTDVSSLKTTTTGLSASVNTNTTDINTLKTDVAALKTSSSSSPQNSSNIDYVSAAQFWALAFGSVVSLWFVSRMSGSIIDAIRRF